MNSFIVAVYFIIVSVFGQTVFDLIPFVKIFPAIVLQVLAFTPFFLFLVPVMAKSTPQFLPEKPGDYLGFCLAQSVLLCVFGFCTQQYFKVKKLQVYLLAQLDLASETTQTLPQLEGMDGLLRFVYDVLGLVPRMFVLYLDNLVLNLLVYLLLLVAFIVATEYRRVKLVKKRKITENKLN